VLAAGLAPIDTAHNTALSIAVSGGLVALFLASAIVAVAIWSITQTKGQLRWALALTLLVWGITSLVATVEENRSTWLMLAMIALAGRLGVEESEGMDDCFSAAVSRREFQAASETIL
jgi:O-antigen ligase